MEKILFSENDKGLFFSIPLFRDLPVNLKTTLLERLDYQVFHIHKKEVVARQNTPCKQLFVLVRGKLRADIIDALGSEIMIEYIVAPRTFATLHLFSAGSTLPATFIALEDSILLTATKESLFRLLSGEPGVLKNFLSVTGNCNQCTVTRLRVLFHKNVRSRFIAYLLANRGSDPLKIHLVHNQAQLAEYLCVTRPALSREISKIVKEGLIRVDGKEISLLDVAQLNRYIL